MKKKTILALIISILLIPNLPFINKFIAHRLDEGHFTYANLDGSYVITQDFSFKSPGFSTLVLMNLLKRHLLLKKTGSYTVYIKLTHCAFGAGRIIW